MIGLLLSSSPTQGVCPPVDVATAGGSGTTSGAGRSFVGKGRPAPH